MSVKTSYNQIGFAILILQLLAEKPRNRDDLSTLLENILQKQGKSEGDIKQKLTRTIRKLRDCGIEIKSAPHHPYELLESNFPVILSTEQRQALAIAAYFLADMGFSKEASQIKRIGNITLEDIPGFIKVDFSPPVDYSEDKLEIIVRELQDRFLKQRRYTIRYQSKSGGGRIWDVDRSELRLHNGTLYLFAFIPDWNSSRFDYWHNIEQNMMFRLDRIANVGAASDSHWISSDFPTLKVKYRMSGQLWNYQPRRKDEVIKCKNSEEKYCDIEATIDYWFWFRQRILKYGKNARILTPEKFAEEIEKEYQEIYEGLGNG